MTVKKMLSVETLKEIDVKTFEVIVKKKLGFEKIYKKIDFQCSVIKEGRVKKNLTLYFLDEG